ncbi:MAG TPA: DUF6049 family protein [Acidimicrobiales bacterium]|nr:DUF6049 family protein [Acidimicrobiales bacterium]
MRGRLHRLAGAAGLALAAALAASAPAVAVAGPSPTLALTDGSAPVEHLSLVSQTPWAGPGGVFSFRVTAAGSLRPSELRLYVTVYPRLRSRSAFGQSLANRSSGYPLWVDTYDLGSEHPDKGGAYQVCIPVGTPSLACPPDIGVLKLNEGSDAGVYPVDVSLRQIGTGVLLDRFTTHLIDAGPGPAAQKLSFAWILPLSAPSALAPDGSRRLTGPDLASLATMTAALADRSNIPVTLAPDPATLAALAADPEPAAKAALAQLRAQLPGMQVMPRPFAPASAYDLVSANLGPELTRQINRGADIEHSVLGLPPLLSTWLVNGPIDKSSVASLVGDGVLRLVVPNDQLSPIYQSLTPDQPFALDYGSGRVPAVVVDSGLASHFSGSSDTVLAAHQLLADLSQIYFELPGATRGVVTVTPRSWRPDRQFLGIVSHALATSPLIQPTTVDGLFATVRPTSRRRQPAVVSRNRPSLPAGRVRNDLRRQQAFATALAQPVGAVATMGDLVLESEADGLSARQRAGFLSGAEQLLSTETRQVQVPRARSLTLTARDSVIPITLQSQLPVPVRVTVRFSSDGLEFTAGKVRDIDRLVNQHTIRLPVRARSSGSFPLRVQVFTPDGSLLLAESRFEIHSTAISGVGIVLSGGAGLFLAVWWGRALWVGRRSRNPRLVPE